MKNEKPLKAPPGAVPPIIPSHVCFYPAKEKPIIPKPAPAAPPKLTPERTLEQRVADEVERRLANRGTTFALGFLLGEIAEQFWHKHHKD